MPDRVLHFILWQYDVKELHTNDKSVSSILRWSEFAPVISVSPILI
jgi:hypothetical protein